MDQRKHRRYPVKEDAFAWLEGDSGRLGKVVDISPGGLAFQYVSDAGPSSGSHDLGIFLASNKFHLEGIRSRVVSDEAVSQPHSVGHVPVRRCGVRFENLAPDQASQLDLFVEQHATGEVQNS